MAMGTLGSIPDNCEKSEHRIQKTYRSTHVQSFLLKLTHI
jgi:hypothetical protein